MYTDTLYRMQFWGKTAKGEDFTRSSLIYNDKEKAIQRQKVMIAGFTKKGCIEVHSNILVTDNQSYAYYLKGQSC